MLVVFFWGGGGTSQAAKEDADAAITGASPSKGATAKRAASARRGRNGGEATLTSEEILTHLGQAFVRAG